MSSSPPSKKSKKSSSENENFQAFATVKTKSGYPMAHTMFNLDPRTFMEKCPFQPRSKFEMIMMAIGGTIRDKPNWWTKVFDEEIVQKWKNEIVQQTHDPNLPYYKRSPTQALPQTFKYYLMDVVDDGDVNYTPKEHFEEDSIYDEDDYEEETPEEVEKITEEGLAIASEPLDEMSGAALEKLNQVLYADYQVQADKDGYLIANPNYKAAEEDGGDDKKEEEGGEGEDPEEASDEDDVAKTQEKILLALFEYALKECQWMATKFEEGPSHPAAVQGVYCRDDLMEARDGNLYKNLLEEIHKLREKPAIGHTQEDRHPGTPAMVDLVHPSLYCYERGTTPVLENVGAEALVAPSWDDFLNGSKSPTIVEEKKDDDDNDDEEPDYNPHSFESEEGLQWLPSEFVVDSTTNACRINSYINNLHPKQHTTFYEYIGELFVLCLPLLEDTLNDKVIMEPPETRIDATFTHLDGDEEEVYYNEDWDIAWKKMYKTLDVIPEVPKFEPYEKEKEEKKEKKEDDKKEEDKREAPTPTSLKDRPLQVIVKIASLELTPDDHPTNPAGSWHVEGCLDERIVATACCYLETTNIQEGSGDLQFRIAVSNPYPEQNDWFGVEAEYDITEGKNLVQPRGSCSAKTGRVLAWSNVWQHRVDRVQLADTSQPGNRTIVCFFLVDPTLRVRSTATVPPQQKAWLYPQEQHDVLKNELSELVANEIASNVEKMGVGLSYEEACERRTRLMSERSGFHERIEQEGDDEFLYGRGFSLCEH